VSHVFAVDLGGTKTSIAIVDESGRILDKQKLPAIRSFESTVEQIAARHEQLKGNSIVAAGVIVPGIYNSGTGNAWAPNLWGKDFHPLHARLQQHLSIPVEIGSDRVATALAEQWLGVAREFRHVVFVAVGTGIGVGIIANGRPLDGAHGIAGAAGWMLIGGAWKPEYTACGGWETEAAGPALARRAGKQTAEAAIEAARRGDTRSLEAVRQTADYLAMGIGALIAILDPEIVVLGGGVMQASDLMLEQMRRNALNWTQPVTAKHVRIEKTALGEDAGLLGAARLACLKAGI
jgi:glucokinase